MEILIKVVQLLASLSILVLVHELGHFMFARLFKCRVDKFYLFFDAWFAIFKKKIGDTEYGIGWLPLGGYCKISGMVDESMDKDQMAQPAQPWEYRSKPAWQRLFIIIGGVLMNFILAMVIYIGITYAWGDSYIKNADVYNGFVYSSEAQAVGFRNGDKIISVDGKTIDNYAQIQSEIILSDKREIQIERDGERQTITIAGDQVKDLLNAKSLISLRQPLVIGKIEKDGAADKAGLMAGDSIVGIDSIKMVYFDEFQEALAQHKNETVNLELYRDGEFTTKSVDVSENGMIGVASEGNLAKYYKISTAEYTLWQAIPKGVERGFAQLGSYLKQLKLIPSPETEAYKSVGGFITMGKIFPSEWNWFSFWNITALLSIMLAVINILPIPALDGGHMVFILYEMITRRSPSQKVLEVAQYIGFFLILALLIYANGSDIMRLFTK